MGINPKPKVVIIEDEPYLDDGIKFSIENDYNAIVCEDYQNAKNYIQKNLNIIDMILMDIYVGCDVSTQLFDSLTIQKENPNIITLSAHSLQSTRPGYSNVYSPIFSHTH